MRAHRHRGTFRSLCLLLALAAVVPGCYAEARPDAPPSAYLDYEPQYYNGYVVYYDDFGHPFYYVDGVTYWVPVTSPLYVGLVGYWHGHIGGYRGWYSHHGYQYHAYRHWGYRGYGGGYRGYHGGYRGGGHVGGHSGGAHHR